MSHGTQTAAAETAEFTRRSLEQGSRFAESLLGAKTVEAALQVQGEYLRSSYEGLVAQTSRMGQLAAGVAKDAAAPLEGLFSKAAPSA